LFQVRDLELLDRHLDRRLGVWRFNEAEELSALADQRDLLPDPPAPSAARHW
jgi:hypothetical protein